MTLCMPKPPRKEGASKTGFQVSVEAPGAQGPGQALERVENQVTIASSLRPWVGEFCIQRASDPTRECELSAGKQELATLLIARFR